MIILHNTPYSQENPSSLRLTLSCLFNTSYLLIFPTRKNITPLNLFNYKITYFSNIKKYKPSFLFNKQCQRIREVLFFYVGKIIRKDPRHFINVFLDY